MHYRARRRPSRRAGCSVLPITTLHPHGAPFCSRCRSGSFILTSSTIGVSLVGRGEGRVLEHARVATGSSYAVQSSPEARRAYVPSRCLCTRGSAPPARIPRPGPRPGFPHDNWLVCTCPGRTRLARHACCAPRCARAARLVASRACTKAAVPSRLVTSPPRLQARVRTRSRTRSYAGLPARGADACGTWMRTRRITSYSGRSLECLCAGSRSECAAVWPCAIISHHVATVRRRVAWVPLV